MKRFKVLALACFFLSFASASPLIIDTEPEPSTMIEGVSAISGNYTMSCTDIVVQGVEPIPITRSFNGIVNHRFDKYFERAGGWEWFGFTYAIFAEGTLHLWEPNGTALLFHPKHLNYEHDTTEFVLNNDALEGYCNTSRGYPSAEHDITNYTITAEPSVSAFVLSCADKTKRRYKCIAKDDQGAQYFLLECQHHPNGNWTHYQYRFPLKTDKKNIDYIFRYPHTNGLSRVWTSNPSKTSTYAWVDIKYTSDRNSIRNFQLITSDHKTVNYKFESIKKLDPTFWQSVKKPFCYLLTHVYGPSIKDERISYYFDKKHADPLIACVHHPDKRMRILNYYRNQNEHIELASGNQHIKNYKHPVYQRVRSLLGIIDDAHTQLHHFTHEPEKKKCTAYDANGNYRIFYYSLNQRLRRIEYYSNTDQLKKIEMVKWDGYRLKQRITLDNERNPIITREYEYDKRGNVTKELVKGQITRDGLSDTAITTRRFEDDLLIEETNPIGLQTLYSYLPGTNLITEKAIFGSGKQIRRHRFVYDQDHILIKEIEDDLTSINKIRTIEKNQDPHLYGLPKVITRYGETLLKKQKLYYDQHGNIQKREIFDANDKLRYSLQNEYDPHGNPIKQTNPIGQSAYYKYDANQNLIETIGFGGLKTTYTYDLQNREIYKTQNTPEGDERVFETIYDHCDQVISKIDQYKNSKEYTYDALGNCIEDHMLGVTTKRQFDAMSNITAGTDADGNTTRTTYNIYNQPLTTTYPDGSKEIREYDLAGNLVKYTSQVGIITCYERDKLGRWLTKTVSDKSAQLAQEHKNYNGFECTSHTDACGYKTNYTYDTSGRLIQKEREGILTAYAYDELGRQSATTIGKTTERLEYDLLDRVITNSILAKNELCFFEKYTYDKYGNKDSIERTIDDKKAIESFCYDAFSRLREHCDAAGYKTTITYNEKYDLGKWYVLQKTATDPNGTQTIETFDPHGRIKIRKKDTVLDEFSYSTHYDLLGLR